MTAAGTIDSLAVETLPLFTQRLKAGKNANHWRRQGGMLQSRGKYLVAAELYKKAARFAKGEPVPQLRAAFCLVQAGRNADAKALLDGLLAEPDLDHASRNEANTLIEQIGS